MTSHICPKRLRSLSRPALAILCWLGLSISMSTSARESNRSHVDLNTDGYQPSCGIDVRQDGTLIQVTWPMEAGHFGRFVFDLDADQPFLQSAAVARSSEDVFQTIAEGLEPMVLVRVGDRDLERRNGWTIFFDRMQNKPNEVFPTTIDRSQAIVTSNGQRATLTIGKVSAGPFEGTLRWTFFAENAFVLQEAVLSTERNRTAFLFDVGFTCHQTQPSQMTWWNATGTLDHMSVDAIEEPTHLAVRGRTIAAEFEAGSIGMFPPPHRYFYPLDFSNNFKNVWMGPNYEAQSDMFGFGIRHDPNGDDRFVPWFNAPPGTEQEMGVFLLLSEGSGEQLLNAAARLTRNDQFESLPEHVVFSSHYHVEHTRELLNAQASAEAPEGQEAQLPSGESYQIPPWLVNPGFVQKFREHGVEIVHLAEFHFGRTPQMSMDERVQHLELLHAECQRLSNNGFLLLPGEEPNVHLGGHWLSFFPRPVYWVLNRPDGTPFVTDHPELGPVYHVGSEADILQLLRVENGLAWTAHPRIKGSTGFPDAYRDRLFYQTEQFLGAAWKAMPADLSQPRLGARVLDLLDDMSNWGSPKVALGEVDVFEIEPDHELYGHMNVNYLRLDEVPRFEDGWQPVLDALRQGQFFVTTGEVLMPDFTVNDQRSGERVIVADDGIATIRLDLRWTFPLAFLEIITGDGQDVERHRVDLAETGSYGENSFQFEVDVTGQRWLRVEVWDVATNGAFTQPVWLSER